MTTTPTPTAKTSATTAPTRSDSPAVALGPTALVLGVLSTVGLWVPELFVVTLPWTIIGGGLGLTLGLAGIHQARLGVGRMWASVVGTVAGAASFGWIFWLFLSVS
ncbi:hypothetical protein [Streptomyces sp. Da 82-17]|uniref:hypothetical protein n=1 Tax=Streptomyces sp. Da 82-17 TaxID=3377116 RepID=UPI0038D45B57